MTNYEYGQHAALRGCYRLLGVDPCGRDHPDWYAGYDSVPAELRGTAPLTGPIPNDVLERLAAVVTD
jgi:hypothetical protein